MADVYRQNMPLQAPAAHPDEWNGYIRSLLDIAPNPAVAPSFAPAPQFQAPGALDQQQMLARLLMRNTNG